MIQKNKKGYTLLETILVVGIIAIMLIGIYETYRKEFNQYQVNRQAQYIQQIFKGIGTYLEASPTDSTNIATIMNEVGYIAYYVTPTNLISAHLVPTEMISSPTSLQNLFGGTVSFSATSFPDGSLPSVPIVDMKLTNIPQYACALLATNYRIINYEKIYINGTLVKDVGTNVPNFVNVAAACNSNNNTIDIDYYPTRSSASVYSTTNSLAHVRGKDNPYYIAPIGQNTNSPGGSSACYGGASWNSTDSACECPSGSEWNGNTCATYGTPGVCPLGQGWSISSNACIAISGGTTGVYQSGRQIPSNVGITPQITSPQIACTNAALPTGATSPSNGNGNYDGVVCQMCVNGSWNGSRCVTP